MSARVSAVVVYFRTPTALQACLDSLRAQTGGAPEIVVVDNSSAIDGETRRPAAGEDWQWLRMPHNAGFAAACNAGARATTGDHLLVVNGDVVLQPGAVGELLGALEADPQAAIAGPQIIDAAGEVELSARAFPSILTGVLGRSSVATRLLQRAGAAPSGVAAALARRPAVVDWISGACMLIRRDAYEQLGGFDEGYWMYWEDADLCLRQAQAGRHTRFVPSAVVHHATGSSGSSPATVRAFHASATRYFVTHLARSPLSRRIGTALLAARCRVVLARSR